MAEFNTQLVISLVKERPVLWDKTIDLYRDKRRTFEAWREIFTILNDNFEKLGNTEKNEYGHLVMKKWTTLRDCWMKCHRRINTWKPESGAKKVRKYIYYDEMSFLKKIVPRWNSDPLNDNTTTNNDMSEECSTNAKKRREGARSTWPKEGKSVKETWFKGDKRSEESEESEVEETRGTESITGPKLVIETNPTFVSVPTIMTDPTNVASPSRDSPKMLQFKLLDHQEGSRAMAFFSGLAPIVDKFSDEEIVDFQYEVIKAARNIQKRRNTPVIDTIGIEGPLEFKPNISDIKGGLHTSF